MNKPVSGLFEQIRIGEKWQKTIAARLVAKGYSADAASAMVKLLMSIEKPCIPWDDPEYRAKHDSYFEACRDARIRLEELAGYPGHPE
jgi:hypothetical protein